MKGTIFLQSPVFHSACVQLVLAVQALHVYEDLLVVRQLRAEQPLELHRAHVPELIMADGDDDAVRLGQIPERNQLHAVLLPGNLCVSPCVRDDRADLIFLEPVYDVRDLAVARVGAVLFESNAEDDDDGLLGGHSRLYHLLYRRVSDERTHAVVHLAAVKDNLAVIAQLLSRVSQVVGIHPDAVAADQAGPEAEGVPLGVHPRDDLRRVYAHLVTDDGDLVDEGYVDVPLAVLHDLDGLGGLYRGHGESTRLYHDVVDLLHLAAGLLVHAGHDFLDARQRVHAVTGVYALGAVRYLPVGTTLETGFLLYNRDADVLSDARVDRGLEADYRAGPEVLSDGTARPLHGAQVGRGVIVDGRRDRDDNEARLPELGRVGAEFHRGVLDCPAHLVGGVNPVLIFVDALLVDVKADDADVLGKFHGDGHAHVAEPHQRELCLSRDEVRVDVIELHTVSPSNMP